MEQVTEPKAESAAVNTEELLKTVEQLKSTNERLLKESVEHKNKWKSLTEEIDSKKKSELKTKDDFKTLYETTAQEAERLKQENMKAKELVIFNSIKYEVARLCPDAYDVQDVVSKMQIDSSMINPETGEVEGVLSQVDSIKKKYPYLFKTNTVPSVNNLTPSFKKEEPKSLNQLKTNEKFDLLKQVMLKQN